MKKALNEIVSKLYIDKNQKNQKEHNSITSKIRENKKSFNNINSHRKCKINKFFIQTQNFKH